MSHEYDGQVVRATIYRQIAVNDLQASKFCSNSISTTKYSVLTFLPLFLYEQFHNYTNCFFLLVSIIQQFPEASSLGRFTTVIPLSVILIITAVKEILEDVRRHKGDITVNTQTVEVLRNLRWSITQWRDVQVGDLIRVNSDEFFPADLLFLKGSNENGVCYIETVNLDGENNLKIRHQVPGLNVDLLAELSATVQCDEPNEQIYNFNGLLTTDNDARIPLTASHLLLRGAVLKNTKWIIGAVVYTGGDTKIMKNSSATRLKRSSVSVMINSHIIVLFALFVTYTLVHWLLFMDWNNDNYSRFWYLSITSQNWTDGSTIVLGLVFGVIYSLVIPISLPVMLELSRLIQAVFIGNDLDMYCAQQDVPALVKTSSLNEDLALVKYIFADKTGTLTKNILEFKCCSIRGAVYTATQLRQMDTDSLDESVQDFCIAVAICPGVVPVRDGNHISYFVSSPDQKALVLAAREFGVTLLQRTDTMAELEVGGVRQRYEVKCDFEFTSERKRSSTVVRSPTGELRLFVIGADDVVLARCRPEAQLQQTTRRHLEQFASQGLRSLCVATARIQPDRFERWYPTFVRAREALHAKETLLAQAEATMVGELSLMGCTAIEDQLQDAVPETIEALLRAGVNVWMLTGDKQETAINIGYACRLLTDETPLIVLNAESVEKLHDTVEYYRRVLGERFGRPGNNYGLVVGGDSLKAMLDSPGDVDSFVSLMLSVRAVICCRTTPKQKALVVKSVQKRTRFVTLAVGDGANDVAMIQTASIGVGISGMEGLQAANAADYSIGQFRYLKKLLLVHGSWSYHRICTMIYFMYYKNVAVTTIQFYLNGYSAWSGQLFFDRWAKMLYNVMLTSAPTLALGIFEQNLPAETLLANPWVYLRNRWFDWPVFCCCLANAFLHSALLSWLAMAVFDASTYWSNGRSDHYMIVGNIVYTCLVTIVCLKSGLHSSHWTNVTCVFMVASELAWMAVLFILSHAWPLLYIGEDMTHTFELLVTTPLFWLFLAFSVVVVLGLDLVVIVLYRMFREPMVNKLRAFSLARIWSAVS